MRDNFITKISPNVRLIIFILLMLCLLLAKSIYLVLFITTLTLIFFINTDKKVNLCVKILKKIIILLLIFFVGYIIVFRYCDIVLVGIFLYKLIIITILFEIYFYNTDFKGLHKGLYMVFIPLKKFNVDVENFSFNMSLSLYFFNFLEESQIKIKNAQITRGKRLINIKNFIFPCVIYSINKLEKLQENLKIKFYQLDNNKCDLKSKVILIIFLMLFILCIFKEVVL